MEKKEEEQEYCPYRERLDLDEFETKLGFDTPHQPEKQLNYCKTCVQMTNHKGEVCLKCQPENGYETATDEEKTKMMLQIAKEANAEQKAMCEPEKQPWGQRFDEAFGRFSLGENNGREKGWRSIDMLKPFISQLLKEEQCCLCKDKGVIELIEEAVEAERKRIREGIEKLSTDGHGTSYQDALSDALQVINKEEIPRNPLNQNKWM